VVGRRPVRTRIVDYLVMLLMFIGGVNFIGQFIPGFQSHLEITMALFGLAGIMLGARGLGQRNGKDEE
jgi:hypothetical protein